MTRKARKTKPSSWKRWSIWFGGGAVVIAAMFTIRSVWNSPEAEAQVARRGAANDTTRAQARKVNPNIVAEVNGQPITRDQLGRECLRHYGKKVLESQVNKLMIFAECEQRGISVSKAEVQQEINRLAKRFKISREQFVGMLLRERGIDARQYEQDIVWPSLAMRKLAAKRMQVSDKEIRIAYQQEYGSSVQVRIITLKTKAKAEKVLKLAKADPKQFPSLAKQYSKDINSAPAGGLVQPIRRHVGYKVLEDAAFELKDKEVSNIIELGGQYLIVKREREIERTRPNIDGVRARLTEGIRDTKLQKAAHEEFRRIQESRKKQLRIVLGDEQLRRQYPTVAAFVGGGQITLIQLANECIDRHGTDVLEGLINHALLAQALAKYNLVITKGDMQAEIARAAKSFGITKENGDADVDTWVERVTTEQGVSEDVYRRDSVWPSVALKKLVASQVKVTPEDIDRSFEANYTQRVRCLAIVLDNQRRAHEVWAKARDNPTDEAFGDLAEHYSVDSSSKALRGEIPPVQQHGGRPVLERAAFALKPGELSDIIQMDEKFVILRCTGRTRPGDIKLEEVRDLLVDDIFEKKTRVAMRLAFEKIQSTADIVNHLDTAQSHRPEAKPSGGSHVKLTSGEQPLRSRSPR